jgi:hypothetical protein
MAYPQVALRYAACYVARTRNGFSPASREALFRRLKAVETGPVPLRQSGGPRSGRWGEGLTAAKMRECRWLVPGWWGEWSSRSGRRIATSGTRGSLGCGRAGWCGM